jgi:hypothetical protein
MTRELIAVGKTVIIYSNNYNCDNFVLLKEVVPKLVKLQFCTPKVAKFGMDARATKDPVREGLSDIQLLHLFRF